MSLKLPDSGAAVTPDGRRHAPSAARNAAAILAVLQRELTAPARLLEIASGTGQHAALFAAALPWIDWQPSDVNSDNLTSIRAWREADNLREPVVLDASVAGWAAKWQPLDAVLVVNLLHLIPLAAVTTVLAEGSAALGPGGRFLIYGPFLRDGKTTSDGDAAFDASLRAQDPAIGYKDIGVIRPKLEQAGLVVRVEPMPANNLMLIARRLQGSA
ncbi:MAG: DUF938 domain-containing protein [bacterium]